MKSIFPDSVTLKGVQEGARGTFGESLGLEFVELGPDYLVGRMPVDKRHLRPGGIMNGGVSLALIETVGSVAARCAIYQLPKNTLGIQVSASHLQVAKPGDTLTITARPLHVGRSTHLWDVTIKNQLDRVVSTGRITMMVVEASKLGPSA